MGIWFIYILIGRNIILEIVIVGLERLASFEDDDRWQQLRPND